MEQQNNTTDEPIITTNPTTTTTIVSNNIKPYYSCGEYHENDFDWQQHANEMKEKCNELIDHTNNNNNNNEINHKQSEGVAHDDEHIWNQFYSLQSHRVFKPRTYLLAAFPELGDLLIQEQLSLTIKTLVDLGAGGGASLLPFINLNNNTQVIKIQIIAFDLSLYAVQHLKNVLGIQQAYQGDLTQPLTFPENIGDAALLVFTLSAISPSLHLSCIESAVRVLKPGGKLFFRDYGQWDLIQIRLLLLKGKNNNDEDILKSNGIRTYFFTIEDIEKLFTDAGLVMVEKPRYLTVKLTNRKTGIELKRVWIRAVGIKPLKKTDG
jgi:SAM-dependent methyltransferase